MFEIPPIMIIVIHHVVLSVNLFYIARLDLLHVQFSYQNDSFLLTSSNGENTVPESEFFYKVVGFPLNFGKFLRRPY